MISEQILTMASRLKDDEILDNASTINLFGNLSLISNVHKCTSISINGVGGEIMSNKIGTFSEVFNVHTHQAFDANVLSQARVEDAVKKSIGATLRYDPESCAFELNLPGVGYWNFVRRDDLGGLRVAQCAPETAFVTTVSQNRKQFTVRQLKAADDARKLLR